MLTGSEAYLVLEVAEEVAEINVKVSTIRANLNKKKERKNQSEIKSHSKRVPSANLNVP